MLPDFDDYTFNKYHTLYSAFVNIKPRTWCSPHEFSIPACVGVEKEKVGVHSKKERKVKDIKTNVALVCILGSLFMDPYGILWD